MRIDLEEYLLGPNRTKGRRVDSSFNERKQLKEVHLVSDDLETLRTIEKTRHLISNKEIHPLNAA